MPSLRRIVTGVRDGKSIVLSDGTPPNMHVYEGWPGHVSSVIWTTPQNPDVPLAEYAEAAPAGIKIVPRAGGTQFMIVHLPPDQTFSDPRFDQERYAAEAAVHIDGLLQSFEPDAPGMHTTDTVDYDIVLQGEVDLELDEGRLVHLKQGDVVVQGGTRHAWRNKTSEVAILAFVLIGASRISAP